MWLLRCQSRTFPVNARKARTFHVVTSSNQHFAIFFVANFSTRHSFVCVSGGIYITTTITRFCCFRLLRILCILSFLATRNSDNTITQVDHASPPHPQLNTTPQPWAFRKSDLMLSQPYLFSYYYILTISLDTGSSPSPHQNPPSPRLSAAKMPLQQPALPSGAVAVPSVPPAAHLKSLLQVAASLQHNSILPSRMRTSHPKAST